jgi:hypothetical protein
VKKKIPQTAGRFEPSRAQSLFDTQKSLSEMYLINFCFSRNFRSEKLFAESFGTRKARKNRTMVRTFVPKCLLGRDRYILFDFVSHQ